MTAFDAEAWARAGVSDPAEARSWRIAGVTPDEVRGWRDAGIGFAEAAAWREFGYSLEQAREEKRRGRKPSDAFRRRVSRQPQPAAVTGTAALSAVSLGRAPDMQTFLERIRRKHPELLHGYFQRRWLDDEAVAWARAGIDAGDAEIWKEFGIAPAEASRLAKAGRRPAPELRAWWEAGIPPDEVAAWLGAGLTAPEAAEQRARGISAETAAVMRALRDPGAGD